MKKWKTLSTEKVFTSAAVNLVRESCELEDGRVKSDYMILEALDWVNIIALTKENKILLVEQYRHGAQIFCLEIPGGSMDCREEQPEAAARRELKEETGFEAGELVSSLVHYPNPALQNNRLHTFLFKDCFRGGAPQWDEFEEMEVSEVTLQELEEKIKKGQINHSLILASLFLLWPQLKKQSEIK